MRRQLIYAGGILTAIGIAACTDREAVPPSTAPQLSPHNFARATSPQYGHPEITDDVRRRVDVIAKRMATQFASQANRGRMAGTLRASTSDDEHKVSLGQALAGIDGGASRALATAVKSTPRGAPRNFGDLENELEVYMPV